MKSRQASGHRGHWGEVLLGGLAGLGVPVLLLGVARGRGVRGSLATVGAVAGLLGAWVGGGLARRQRGAPERREPSREEAQAGRPEPRQEGVPEPRRGPSGRERHWHPWGASAHTS